MIDMATFRISKLHAFCDISKSSPVDLEFSSKRRIFITFYEICHSKRLVGKNANTIPFVHGFLQTTERQILLFAAVFRHN